MICHKFEKIDCFLKKGTEFFEVGATFFYKKILDRTNCSVNINFQCFCYDKSFFVFVFETRIT
jgi:hypothetical protein